MTSPNQQFTVQQAPFLRVQRSFPTDNPQALAIEIDRAYVDTASKVNNRTIGIFPTNFPVTNGEQWFLQGETGKQQALRQVYQITSYAAFNHGLNFSFINFFTKIYGIGFDGTNYFPIPYVSAVAVADQVGIYVTPTQVTFSSGAGSPVITEGIVILEWLSNV